MFLIDILLVILLAAGSGWSICVLSEGCRRLLATQTKEMTLDTFKTGVKGELFILVISTTLIGDFIWYAGHLRLHYVYGEYIVPIRFTQIVIPILIILLLYINNKMNRNPLLQIDCIVQALNMVPVGIAFVNKAGVPVLINHKMYEINQLLLGEYIPNMEITWSRWKIEGTKKYPISGCTYGEFELYFGIEGKVWRISREFLDIGFWQIRAEEITRLHETQIEVEKTLKRLEEENKKYVRMIQNIVNVNSEHKYLNLKMSLHRGFGDCMQFACKYIRGEQGRDKLQMLRIWQQLLGNLTDGTSRPEKVDEKRELVELATLFHCTLIFPPQKMFHKSYDQIFYFCVREAMMNAIRHGAATRVFVTQQLDGDKVRICIKDNGTGLKGEFHEGGGISGIRDYLKQRDIPLYIKEENGRLFISFLLER